MLDLKHLYERHFPRPLAAAVADFKFQNTGHAAAVLWKFCLVVEEVKIDPQPVLFGRLTVEDRNGVGTDTRVFGSYGRTLRAAIRNDGWGAALDCELTLRSPILDILVPLSAREVRVAIPAGTTYDLLLAHAVLDQEKLVSVRNSLRDQAKTLFDREFANMIERRIQDKRR